MAYVHPFLTYDNPRDYDRCPRIFQLRDGAATIETLAAMNELGYKTGETLLNAPGPNFGEEDGPPLYRIDLSRVERDDVIATTTRPPLSDLDIGNKKKVHRAWTDLEQTVLDNWEEILNEISRSWVSLAPRTRRLLREGYENRRAINFLSREGAPYSKGNARDGQGPKKLDGTHRTAAFLLRREELWPGGPGYVGTFGMDGTMSVIWAYLLRHKHAELLEKPGFTMVEMTTGPLPERPSGLHFSEGWEVEIIAHEVF